jgi:superfamily II DNA or RNA helicase
MAVRPPNILIVNSTENLRQLLIRRYHQMPSLEQTMVQLFSVMYEPVSRATYTLCLTQLGITDSSGRPFNNQTLKPYIDRLLALEVITQSGNQGPQCHPMLAEVATREAVRAGKFKAMMKVVQKQLPLTERWKGGPVYFTSSRQLVREVRLGIYSGDVGLINRRLDEYEQYRYSHDDVSLDEIFQQVCNSPFDADWFSALSDPIRESALSSILNVSMLTRTPAQEAFTLLENEWENPDHDTPDLQKVLLLEQLVLRGKLTEAERVLDSLTEPFRSRSGNLWGILDVLRGDTFSAINHYTQALQDIKKATGKRKIYFQSVSGLFFVLALLKAGTPDRLKEAEGYAATARQAKHWLSSIYGVLENLLKVQQGDLARKNAVLVAAPHLHQQSLEVLFCALCVYWVDENQAKLLLPETLKSFYQEALTAGYEWLAMEAAEIVARLQPNSPYAQFAADLRKNTDVLPLVDLLQPQATWELSLNALINLQKKATSTTAAKTDTTQRLAWFVTLVGSRWILQPREQSLNAKGEWGRGRPIALKRLKNDPGEFTYLTDQDRQVCAQIKTSSYNWGKTEYGFNDKAIGFLVGHPLVFWEESATRIEVVKGEPELIVKQGKGDRLTLQFVPELKESNLLVVKESPTRLKVIEVTPEHRRIAEVLGSKNRLDVPAVAKDRVLEAIHAISSIVTVHSDIGGGTENAVEVPADPKPHIHLLPAGSGLRVAMLVRPFAQTGSYYRPGAGGETVIADIDGQKTQTTRDLRQEKQLAKAAIAACPTLNDYPKDDGEWWIEEPEDCLELLLELQALGDTVIIEWPEGEKLRVSRQAGLGDFQLKIQRQNDWFATSGELKLDSQTVIDMQQLLNLLDQSAGRFVPLGDGQFLALTQEFRKRLEELRAYTEKSGKNLRLHPLAAVALEDWVDEVGSLKADKYWKAHIEKLKEVQTLDPKLPSTLQADLRDYQLDGFRWLSQLAHWGVGACLADDMGLGKTLQALALILSRAAGGATLVIAPTSVCMNWLSEAQKFAPTLNIIQFGGGNRQKVLDQLQPLDLVICSYGLLQQEEVAEMLAKVQWQTIVLDEAQSIKNFATKRSQAAMNLQGGFKLITTGTPIENHLGELWNLFRFINPGLLGSLESFNQRFAVPIERYQDKAARLRLKKLIQPFLLRRTKNQVLEELPSRTEILLHVELSQEEMAFYEALRQQAITRLAESDATAGAKHLQVLAEIMKLRRACCNPQLVTDLPLPSAKLNLFGEVLTELLENRHKALVFSQFVDHLHILQAYLDEQKIAYQYLDGSTPAAERKRRVEAFQSGEGDVFLISLKAGGTGLNLTAADFVIHMDPWWNPAVEDQASDRAHRIGQQRPVTIYRLVAKNTIEEKIVALHTHKRDLADSLLEGTEVSGKISTDDLLRLIQEG